MGGIIYTPPLGQSLVEIIAVDDINTAIPAQDYTLILKAKYGLTLNNITIKSSAGTCNATLSINGVAVTGISAVGVSSVQADYIATAANTVVAGDLVKLTLSANAALDVLQATIKTTRT